MNPLHLRVRAYSFAWTSASVAHGSCVFSNSLDSLAGRATADCESQERVNKLRQGEKDNRTHSVATLELQHFLDHGRRQTSFIKGIRSDLQRFTNRLARQ
jgi:hypothetical protein